MATVKVKFRMTSRKALEEGMLYYQIVHNRKMRRIPVGFKIRLGEWNADLAEIAIKDDVTRARVEYLENVRHVIVEGVQLLQEICNNLKIAGRVYTVDTVAELFALSHSNKGFLSFTRRLIENLEKIGKYRTAENYATTLHSFTRYRHCIDLPIVEIDSVQMVEYEVYLKTKGICLNTVSYYMRNLRAIYNRAVEMELTPQRNPFKHVYTGIDKTTKRAIPLCMIRKIRDMDLSHQPSLDFARDMFMFSFYTRGMSFVDMAYLKKNDLRNGIITYRRQKTGQLLLIKWERQMHDIISKYDTLDTPYLLPIIRNIDLDHRRQYKSAAHLVNKKLKQLGQMLQLSIPLTTYVARHAWASIVKSKNISVSIISEAMGHDSESTTRIYLASLDNSSVDKANRLILKSL